MEHIDLNLKEMLKLNAKFSKDLNELKKSYEEGDVFAGADYASQIKSEFKDSDKSPGKFTEDFMNDEYYENEPIIDDAWSDALEVVDENVPICIKAELGSMQHNNCMYLAKEVEDVLKSAAARGFAKGMKETLKGLED